MSNFIDTADVQFIILITAVQMTRRDFGISRDGSEKAGFRTQTLSKKNKNIFFQEPSSASSTFFSRSADKCKNYCELKIDFKPQVVHSLQKCKQLWDEFSSKDHLFETWEFRKAFNDAYRYKPHFLLLKNHKENLALLPLCHENDSKRYTWFGTNWQEEVKFFTKYPGLIPHLLNYAPRPLQLDAISGEQLKSLGSVPMQEDDPKYILDLAEFRNHEDYLATLKKNDRRNLRKDRNRIQKMSPKIQINKFSDLKYLIRLSVERFTRKGEDTDWDDKRRINAFKKVIKMSGKSYEARMISIRIGRKLAGVDLVCLCNGTYFAVKCGYDVYSFPGIGNYMNLYEIDDAIKLGKKRIDFLQSSYSWKNKFFKAVPLFKIEKI